MDLTRALHIIPVNDCGTMYEGTCKIHEAHAGCWCHPVVEDPFPGEGKKIRHNAKDTRESYERQTNECLPGKNWQLVWGVAQELDMNITH